MSKKDRETYQIKEEAKQFFDPEYANLKLTMIAWGQMGIGITSQALEKVKEEKRFKVEHGSIPNLHCVEQIKEGSHSISMVVSLDGVGNFNNASFKNKLAQIMEKAINEAHEKGEI